jgi:GDPmannose 4,6-dehydratase
VLATGETHTIREFAELAFIELGIALEWVGEGEEERGIDQATGQVRVDINPRYYRPTEVDLLLGNPEKARAKLGWVPEIKFKELVKLMTFADYEKIQKRGY